MQSYSQFNFKFILLLACTALLTFSCNKKEAPKGVSNKIVITTSNTIALFADSAIIGGNISDDGGDNIRERGVCYSTAQNPTLNDLKVASGSGKGNFIVKLLNLKPNTNYYVRAYCLADQGEIFGNQIDFKTLPGRPVLTTNQISNIQFESATGGATIVSDGGAAITERGLCVSSVILVPTRVDTFISSGQGNAPFTTAISGLQPNRTYYVRAYAKNSQGESYAGNTVQFKTLPAQPPIVNLATVDNITRQSARVTASILSNQGSTVTQYGLCVSTSSLPTIFNSTVINFFGSPLTSFFGDVSNLNPNTTYYVRAFAYNGAGGPSYSASATTFTTLALQPPVVSTVLIGPVTLSTALVTANLSDDGGSAISERGFYYSLNSIPTTSSPKVIVPGNSIGIFSASLNNLTSNSLYYVTAYARNSIGLTISNNILNFRTLTPSPPIITTNLISNLTSTSFESGGTISSDGGAPIIQKGICWNTTGNPTIVDSRTLNGSGTNSFSASTNSIMPLTQNVTYFVRAYATNSGGVTGYGNQSSILTKFNTVQLSSPLNGANIGCCTQTLSWSSITGVSSYEIEISMSNTFSFSVYNLPSCGSGSLISNRVNRITSTNPSICIGMGSSFNNGTWFWRVRALSLNNSSDWSEVRSFIYRW